MERYKAFVRRNAGVLSLLETGEQGLARFAVVNCRWLKGDQVTRFLGRFAEQAVFWKHFDAQRSCLRSRGARTRQQVGSPND